MVLLKMDQLVPGVVLSENVRDINSRLLLAKGQNIDQPHIRILKM